MNSQQLLAAPFAQLVFFFIALCVIEFYKFISVYFEAPYMEYASKRMILMNRLLALGNAWVFLLLTNTTKMFLSGTQVSAAVQYLIFICIVIIFIATYCYHHRYFLAPYPVDPEATEHIKYD